MQYTPIKTRVIEPPQDDLMAVLNESLTTVDEGDVLVITSKVVSIHLGLCIPKAEVETHALTEAEADHVMYKAPGKTLPLTIKHHTLLYRAGIDSSNSGDYYTVLPKDPYREAAHIRTHVQHQYGVKNLGVIISDSTVLPFRKGVVGISLGVAGFVPFRTHDPSQKDLFNEPVIATSTNLADALAAGASVVSGEADESTPIVQIKNVPNITFTDQVIEADYLMPPERDLYRPLLDHFFES